MIRYARPADHAAIGSVVAAAFGRPDESHLVERLRTDEDSMFEMVAEQQGEIVGHILFSRLWADRDALYAALAPLSVRPDVQGSGLGSALARAGIEGAKEFGAHGVLVLGNPLYYARFGFASDLASQVRAPYQGLAAFQALALEPAAFDTPMMVAYPDAFAG